MRQFIRWLMLGHALMQESMGNKQVLFVLGKLTVYQSMPPSYMPSYVDRPVYYWADGDQPNFSAPFITLNECMQDYANTLRSRQYILSYITPKVIQGGLAQNTPENLILVDFKTKNRNFCKKP